MTETTTSRPPYLLFASLFANGILIGLLASSVLTPKSGGLRSAQAGEYQIARGIDDVVSADDKREVRAALRGAFRDTRQQREQLRQARQALKQTMLADPYDREAVRSAFEDLREADSSVKVGLHDVLAEQLANLSLEQREAIMSNIEEGKRRRRRGNGERRDRSERGSQE